MTFGYLQCITSPDGSFSWQIHLIKLSDYGPLKLPHTNPQTQITHPTTQACFKFCYALEDIINFYPLLGKSISNTALIVGLSYTQELGSSW